MRIVYINSVYKQGSTGNLVFNLHSYCNSQNIESFVLYGRGRRIKEPNIFKCSFELLSKLNQIRAKITGIVYGGNFISTSKIVSKLKKIKPDIVHIHNLNDQYVNEYRLLKFLAKSKIKTIVTLHSEQMYTGTCGHALDCKQFMEGGCTKCEHIYFSTNSNVDRTKMAFKKLQSVYKLFDEENLVFVSCTPWLKKRSDKSILISRFRNDVILNGGNDKLFFPTDNEKTKEIKNKMHLPLDKKILLHVNPRASDPIKGYQFIKPISEKIPNSWCICVVGKTPSDFVDKNNVIHVGEIKDSSVMSSLYASSDLTIMLSSRESFPMVIVESLLCGTPIAAFKCGGPDDCYPNQFVKFSDYGNVDLLIDNVKQLFYTPRHSISDFARANLTNNIMCEKYINLYKNL